MHIVGSFNIISFYSTFFVYSGETGNAHNLIINYYVDQEHPTRTPVTQLYPALSN